MKGTMDRGDGGGTETRDKKEESTSGWRGHADCFEGPSEKGLE